MTSQKNWDFYYRTIRRLAPDAEHEQYSYFRIVGEIFRSGMTWLDAGCGHRLVPEWMKGAAELELKFIGEAGQIVGCDVDPAALGMSSSIPRVASRLEAPWTYFRLAIDATPRRHCAAY